MSTSNDNLAIEVENYTTTVPANAAIMDIIL